LQAVADEGKSANTLVIYMVGDNGASGEGGQLGGEANLARIFGAEENIDKQIKNMDRLGSADFDNHFATPWAWATNTPFQFLKQMPNYLGASRDPLVVSWPKRIKEKGGLRTQFQHVTDITPTILDAAGIPFPTEVNGVKQLPLEGVSMVPTFDNPKATGRHTEQYFEINGNRAIYKDGWFAGATHQYPWERNPLHPSLDDDTWELYNLDKDYSQAHDLAASNPAKLAELKTEFDKEAGRNNVYPILTGSPLVGLRPPNPSQGRTSFVYRGDVSGLPLSVLPDLSQPHRITADLVMSKADDKGVIIALGGRYGGFTMFVKDQHVVYEVNAFNESHVAFASTQPLPTGKVQVALEFTTDPQPKPAFIKSGTARLFINGKSAGEQHFDKFGGFFSSIFEPMDIGRDTVSAVSSAYEVPFAFTGTIDKVQVDLTQAATSPASAH